MSKLARNAIVAALLASAIPVTAADAATLIVNIDGVQSFDGFGDSSNSVFSYNIGAGATLTGVTYDVTISTFGASWLSEAKFAFTDSLVTTGVIITPGFADSHTGTAHYADTVDLVAEALSFSIGADGILRLEFYEGFDDVANAADAIYTTGTLTFTYTGGNTGGVPEPATWAMLIAGFGMAGAAMRRRQKMTVTYA